MKVLISDKISDQCLAVFENYKNIEVIYKPEAGKDIPLLKELIKDVDGLAIRSATKVTPEILDVCENLKVIGRAGIGVDNVDIPYASQKGIIVMNTPTGNVITTAEHAISMMCAMARRIPQATASTKSGKWEKAKFMGTELTAKNLGLIGCGNIGKIVADRANGLKMNVLAFDPFLTEERAKELHVQKVSLGELFEKADFITVHTPLNDKTKNLINKEAFLSMKNGVYIINCARGGIVNEEDLDAALESGKVAGAALDVFVEEPVSKDHPLLNRDNVIVTPHLGASTEEAQVNVALDVAHQIGDFLTKGTIVNALNTASASSEVLQKIGPAIDLCFKIGSFHGQLCEESPKKVNITYYGDINKYPSSSLTSSFLQGLLKPMVSDESVNSVNAPYLAKERGIEVCESKSSKDSDYNMLIEVELEFANSKRFISGTLLGKSKPRIVKFEDVYPELLPQGTILIVENLDQPGVVGNVGSFLGQENVNISRIQLGVDAKTKNARAFYNVEQDVCDKTIAGLKEISGIVNVKKVNL